MEQSKSSTSPKLPPCPIPGSTPERSYEAHSKQERFSQELLDNEDPATTKDWKSITDIPYFKEESPSSCFSAGAQPQTNQDNLNTIKKDPENPARTSPETLRGDLEALRRNSVASIMSPARVGPGDQPFLSPRPKMSQSLLSPLVQSNVELLHLGEADLTAYRKATRRLLLFDYDGTLADIVTDPAKATIPNVPLYWLETLAKQQKNEVWIISGRTRAFLLQQFGHIEELGLVAEHGAFSRHPSGNDAIDTHQMQGGRPQQSQVWNDHTAGADMSWLSVVHGVFDKLAAKNTYSWIETKTAGLVLHYRLAGSITQATADARGCKAELDKIAAARGWPVELVNGKCVLEARLHNVNKGRIVERILREGGPPEFVLCCGDDVTDEGMQFAPLCNNHHLNTATRYVSRPKDCSPAKRLLCHDRVQYQRVGGRLVPFGPGGGICLHQISQ